MLDDPEQFGANESADNTREPCVAGLVWQAGAV